MEKADLSRPHRIHVRFICSEDKHCESYEVQVRRNKVAVDSELPLHGSKSGLVFPFPQLTRGTK
jgi:hypothetical protein